MLTFILACVLVLAAFPVSALGRALRRALVEAPARRLNAIKPGHIVILVGLALVGLIMFGLFEADGLRVFGMMVPEIAVWFSAFEMSLVLDALVIGLAIATTARLRVMGLMIRRAIQGAASWLARRIAPRERRSSPRPPRKQEESGDPEPWGWAPVLAWSAVARR
ncbi:hypothetical protein [Caulobacter segnis]|uniref:Uncharacterized protein n=1 Tax=Caulobacter segnis TaxID=88688 RepID=A0A2W5X8H5_9CAUL|nr:hypothetical protein [Caulobacter segnis]PZR37384.1 MAG: hypothetical protein DI526_00355 [Caulobacter segnis]